MKLDTSREVAALAKFSEKTKAFGESTQAVGQQIMGFGCLLMFIGLIGFVFMVVIF